MLRAQLRSLWRSLFRRSQLEQEMVSELQFHLDARAAHLMARDGVSREEAIRRARLEFGSAEKYRELIRESLGLTLVVEVFSDVRYALRQMRRSPVFALTATLTLALGIGANTAIFTVIRALLLRPLPVPYAERLVQLRLLRPDGPPAHAFSYPVVTALGNQHDVFDGLFGFAATTLAVGEASGVSQVDAVWVTHEYYETLGVVPLIGRVLGPADYRLGAAPTAVITESFWRRHFGADPLVLGRTFVVYGAPVMVVGVTSAPFTGTTVGRVADVTLPLSSAPQIRPELVNLMDTGANILSVMARPRANLSASQVEGRLATVWPAVVEIATPEPMRQRLTTSRLTVVSGSTGFGVMRERFAAPLLTLMAMVGSVLLIACSNISTLLLARTTARRREITTRVALGASRIRVIRQLLTENLVVSMAGASLGLVVAHFGSHGLLTFFSQGVAGAFGPSPGPGPDPGTVVLDISADGTVLLFTFALACATVLLFGTAPAIRATNATITPQYRTDSSRAAFAILQVALTVTLLTCAGLFVRSLENLRSVDRGFDPEGVFLVDVDPRLAGYAGRSVSTLYRELHEFARRLPGVRSASYSAKAPLGFGETSYPFFVDGEPVEGESLYHPIGPRYFETMRTPVLAGREFTLTDMVPASSVAIVNEAFVRRYSRGRQPLGRRLSITGSDDGSMEIVGVVRDALFSADLRYATTPPGVFVPYEHARPPKATFVVAVERSPASVVRALEAELALKVPNAHIQAHSVSEQLDRVLLQERLVAALSTAFGVLALVLATVGLYGLLTYNVTRRRLEIGVRCALGARRADIIHLVVREAVGTMMAGVVIGLLLAWLLGTVLRRMLFGLGAMDPLTASIAVAILLLSGVVAAYLPARRAARVDPMVALRCE